MDGLTLSLSYSLQCNADVAFDEYFRFWTSRLPNQPAPISLGSGCSVATEPMLTAARFWRTMQVTTNSHTATCYTLQHMQYNPSVLSPHALSHLAPLPPSACMKVSYLSSAPHLSDNSRFPYHVRVEPPESITHKSQGIIAAQFGWEEVTWIVQNERVFVSVSRILKLSPIHKSFVSGIHT